MNSPDLSPIDTASIDDDHTQRALEPSAEALEGQLSSQWGIDRNQICVTSVPWAALFGVLLPEGKRVCLAAPAPEDVLDAIVEAGFRYIDVGRNHAFRVDVQGWQMASADCSTAMAYLGAPSVPTSMMAPQALAEYARNAGNIVIWDHRSQPYDGARASEHGGESNTIRVGIVGCGSGLEEQLPAFLIGNERLIAPIKDWARTQTIPAKNVALAFAALSQKADCIRRYRTLMAWTNHLETALKKIPNLVVLGTEGCGLWVRAPGLPSEQFATLVCHPSVVGGNHWSWRDAVAVYPTEPGQPTSVLLDALESAL